MIERNEKGQFVKGQEPLNKSHGMAKTSIYGIWGKMRGRCNNPRDVAYKNYGGRGIRVCKRWDKFENFLEDMGEKPEGMSIDRIKNDLGYFPENCKWSTDIEQANNRRNNTAFNGVSWDKHNQKWFSELKIGGKRMFFKRYKTHLAACYGRWQAELNNQRCGG